MNYEGFLKINESDMVAVAISDITKEDIVSVSGEEIKVKDNIKAGHKISLRNISEGEDIIKYGHAIGKATKDISIGEHVHTHNMASNLKDILSYEYKSQDFGIHKTSENIPTFKGYRRKDGQVAIRNEIWIVNTTGCINNTSRMLKQLSTEKFGQRIDLIHAVEHNYGCSQLGDDHVNTQKILADLVNHPNAAGILILSLGCENNNVAEFKKVLGSYDSDRVKILITQEHEDEIEEGLKLLEELVEYSEDFKREDIPVSELIVGFKCGASDAFSGLTANPLVGRFSDMLVSYGGTTILTEVPEMFGAETILMDRCISRDTFDQTVSLINDFKNYYIEHGEPISENPAPGNLEGGITTLEEKSLGCIQKGGLSPVVDVLKYGEKVKTKGLNLLESPGNDPVSTTALTASGAHIVMFTTGRGNPLGTLAPTIKIASNTPLAKRKSGWIDFNAGELLDGASNNELTNKLFDLVIRVASGELTKSESKGYRDIGIFKNGVTL